MPQLAGQEIKASDVCSGGAPASSAPATTTGTMREPIEIEASEERQTQDRPGAAATQPGGCVATITTARSPSSPPLALIDANVASRASAASVSDKSHRQKQQQPPPQQQQQQQQQLQQHRQPPTPPTPPTSGAGKLQSDPVLATASDKFSCLDKDRFFRQEQDELNNNSIHAAQSYCSNAQEQYPQAHRLRPSSIQSNLQHNQTAPAKSLTVHSIRQPHSHQPPISPLNLLTGLRMHTNTLRNQQLQHSGARISGTNITSPPPSQFVESSLNPTNDDGGDSVAANNTERTNSRASKPFTGINSIPSYTSIFDKPKQSQQKLTGAPLTPGENQELQQPHRGLTSGKLAAGNSALAQRATSRSPLRKQAAHFDSLSSSRTLLTTISSIGNKSNRQEREPRRLPSVFDFPSNRLRRPVDYDNQSRSQVDFDLEAGTSDDRSRTDDESAEVGDDGDDDDDDDDDECDGLAAGEDEKCPFNGSDNCKPSNRLRTNAADNKRSQEFANKFAGSAARSNRPMRPKEFSPKKSMKSPMVRRKSLTAQPPQQTRISMGDVSSPPPSFDTSASKLQKHDQAKSASCRKLDLFEQVAHLDCDCQLCSKNKQLTSFQNQLYHHQSTSGVHAKLSKFDANSAKSFEKNYPKTRYCHMVLKSIILVLCTLLLLLLLLSAIALSHYLPQSMDKVMNAPRSFNVTIAGRR